MKQINPQNNSSPPQKPTQHQSTDARLNQHFADILDKGAKAKKQKTWKEITHMAVVLSVINTAATYAGSEVGAKSNVHPVSTNSAPVPGALPCSMERLALPQAIAVKDCEQSSCVPLEDNANICKCIRSDASAFMILESGNEQHQGWHVGAFLGDTSDFEVLRVGLSQSGSKQWIVANRNTTSNGIGINSWTIAVFDGPKRFQSPLLFNVEDYGNGTFSSLPGMQGCQILATEWLWHERGLYFVGRWFRYIDGGILEPINSLVLARRLRTGFERERLQTLDNAEMFKGEPLRWLNKSWTQSFENEPWAPAETPSLHHGRIIEANKTPLDRLRLKIKTEEDKQEVMTNTDVASTDSGGRVFQRLGHLRLQRLYPLQYLPADPKACLVGKHAVISPYHKSQKAEQLVVWLK